MHAVILAFLLLGCQRPPRPGPPSGMLSQVGDPVILGNLDAAGVRAALDAVEPRLSHCYVQRLARVPDLQGDVQVRVYLLDDGTVGGTSVVESGLGDSSAETCIAARLAGLRFPRRPGGGEAAVTVRYRAVRNR